MSDILDNPDDKSAQNGEDQGEHYSEEGFWDKISQYAKKAGKDALSPALKMYYAAQDADTPAWAKATVYGALGYFISPIDAIPDVTPFIGYTDDIAVLAAAVAAVAAHIKEEHSEKTAATLKSWFD